MAQLSHQFLYVPANTAPRELKANVVLPQLGSPTFGSQAQLIAMQGTQANIPFRILNVWHDCDTVIVRWVSALKPQQVQGIDVLEVSKSGKKPQSDWVIESVFGEFNSGAWLIDEGCSVSCPVGG